MAGANGVRKRELDAPASALGFVESGTVELDAIRKGLIGGVHAAGALRLALQYTTGAS